VLARWAEVACAWRLTPEEEAELLAGQEPPTRGSVEHRMRLFLELDHLLRRVFVDEPERVPGWLRRHAYEFDGVRPIDLLSQSRPGIRRITDFLREVAEAQRGP
jgi:hypothetical protein